MTLDILSWQSHFHFCWNKIFCF